MLNDIDAVLRNPDHPAWNTITEITKRALKALLNDRNHAAWPALREAHRDLFGTELPGNS